MYDSLVLLSGGLDSAVLANALAAEGRRSRALHFVIGRPSSRLELAAARRVALSLHMPFDTVDLSPLDRAVVGYVPPRTLLLSGAGEKLNLGTTVEASVGPYPVLLAVASYFAHAVQVDEVALALTREDFQTSPERSGFLAAFEDALHRYCPDHPPVRFSTPFAKLTKAEVIVRGLELGADLIGTWSCVQGGDAPCGTCPSCVRRARAFRSAGQVDAGAARVAVPT